VTLPLDAQRLGAVGKTDSPVVLGGRINDRAGASLVIAYEDGSRDPVLLGDDRYFLFEVPAAQVASVRADGFQLVARNADGAVVASTTVPGTWDDPAEPDNEAPLYVSTHSDSSDFTKVYGLDGYVGAADATTLELDYGDGTRVPISIQDDRSYEYTIPADRVDDFMQPRTLEALDADGRVVVSRRVAAVAYWRSRGGGSP
jgi:hypothetical protein